ncbi:hypothetical protein MAJ_08122, partial [Metarhizium majus ARSEF 297]
MATPCSQPGIVPISLGSTSLRSIEWCENVTPPFLDETFDSSILSLLFSPPNLSTGQWSIQPALFVYLAKDSLRECGGDPSVTRYPLSGLIGTVQEAEGTVKITRDGDNEMAGFIDVLLDVAEARG